jgi:DNA-binding NarL/FixJ family response regulator
MTGESSGTPAVPPARVLVVDDDALCVAALVLLLSEDSRVAVIDRARDGAEGVELALRLEPDVVLMDVQMPVMDGLEATRRIRSLLRSTRVVLISGADTPGIVERARSAGASAFLPKGCDPDVLLDALAGRARLRQVPVPTV